MLIAIHKDFHSKIIPISYNNIEHLFISFSINNEPFIVRGVYFPPSSPNISYANYTSTVEDLVYSFVNAKFIFCGDFNLPNIHWSNNSHGLVYSKISCPGSYVHCVPETFAILNCFQVNNVFYTHGSLLDLIFAYSNHININAFSDPMVPEDKYHPSLYIDIISTSNLRLYNTSKSFFNFHKADYLCIKELERNFY